MTPKIDKKKWAAHNAVLIKVSCQLRSQAKLMLKLMPRLENETGNITPRQQEREIDAVKTLAKDLFTSAAQIDHLWNLDSLKDRELKQLDEVLQTKGV